MIERADEFLIITTNNIKALEAVSEIIFTTIKMPYAIQVEDAVPNMPIYYICIHSDKMFDKRIIKLIQSRLESKFIKLLEDKVL